MAVIILAKLFFLSSCRAAASFSRISVVYRVPHLEQPGVASAVIDPMERDDAMIGGRSELGGCRRGDGWNGGDTGRYPPARSLVGAHYGWKKSWKERPGRSATAIARTACGTAVRQTPLGAVYPTMGPVVSSKTPEVSVKTHTHNWCGWRIQAANATQRCESAANPGKHGSPPALGENRARAPEKGVTACGLSN